MQELMLYKFKLDHNADEVIKKFVVQKVKV